MKRFKKYIVVFVCLMLVFVLGDMVASRIVSPEVNTRLALEQFANPNIVTDTALRSYDILLYIRGIFVLTITSVFGYLLFNDWRKNEKD